MSDAANKILIVEDSATPREMASLLLREAGYEVYALDNAEQALEEVKSRRFALFILDHDLPGMSGLEFLVAARAHQPETPAIFVAGSLTLNLAVRISQERVAGIFTKPVDPRTLLRKVTEAIHDHQSTERSANPLGHAIHARLRGATSAPFLGSDSSASGRTASPFSSASIGLNDMDGAYPSIADACGAFAHLRQRLAKVCDFRSILMLQGPEGALFREIAQDLVAQSAFADGPLLDCPREKFDQQQLLEILANLLVTEDAGTLLLTGIEDFDGAQVALLVELLSCRGPFMPFAQRFRVIIGATPRFGERADAGDFDENLFYRLSSLTVTLPSIEEMRADLVPLARFFLEVEKIRHGAAPTTIAPDAAAWLEQRRWKGDCEELRRLVIAACLFQAGNELTVRALEAAEHVGSGGSNPPTSARQPKAAGPTEGSRAPYPEAAPATGPHQKTVLVVEDSATPRQTLELMLREAGYAVISHDNAESALLDAKARRFDLFILDQELPGMSGVEFLTTARAYQAETPAIFVAGSLSVDRVAQISRARVDSIFTKPADPRALLAKVRETLHDSPPESPATVVDAVPPPPVPAPVPMPATAAPKSGANRSFLNHPIVEPQRNADRTAGSPPSGRAQPGLQEFEKRLRKFLYHDPKAAISPGGAR